MDVFIPQQKEGKAVDLRPQQAPTTEEYTFLSASSSLRIAALTPIMIHMAQGGLFTCKNYPRPNAVINICPQERKFLTLSRLETRFRDKITWN